MLILALETSTPQTSLALGTEQDVLGSTSLSWGTGHSEVIVPALHQLLRWSGIELRQLGGVAVGIGPGLFTGLRVGIATARSLAQVLGVRMVGIASLDVLAYSVRYSRPRICAVTDAKRGELFYAFYRSVPGGVARATEYAVGSPDRLAADLEASAEETLLVGHGALLHRRRLEASAAHLDFASPANAFPLALWLLELAIPRFFREEASAPHQVVPMYVRKSDAEINWTRRARGA